MSGYAYNKHNKLNRRERNPLVPNHTPRTSASKDGRRYSNHSVAPVETKASELALERYEKSIYHRAESVRRQHLLRSYEALINGNNFPVYVPLRGQTIRRPCHKNNMYEWRGLWRAYEQMLQKNDPIRHSILMAGDFGPGGLGMGVRPVCAEMKKDIKSGNGPVHNSKMLRGSIEKLPKLAYSSTLGRDGKEHAGFTRSNSSVELGNTPRTFHKYEKFSSPLGLTSMINGNPVDSFLKECEFQKAIRPPANTPRKSTVEEDKQTTEIDKVENKRSTQLDREFIDNINKCIDYERDKIAGITGNCYDCSLKHEKREDEKSKNKKRGSLKGIKKIAPMSRSLTKFETKNGNVYTDSREYIMTPLSSQDALSAMQKPNFYGSFPVRARTMASQKNFNKEIKSRLSLGDIDSYEPNNNLSKQQQRYLKARERRMKASNFTCNSESDQYYLCSQDDQQSIYGNHCEEGVQVDLKNILLPQLDDISVGQSDNTSEIYGP